MLVLTRNVGESIVLPDCEVKVTVLRVTGKHVRLGVEAPSSVAVHRSETWTRIRNSLGAAGGADRLTAQLRQALRALLT